jgi:ATP-dependent RNA helicase DeaD
MKNFNELPLQEPILRALTELGFDAPTPIQAQTLPLLLGKKVDFLGLAATGTGKTAAFSLPLLERIDPKKRSVQGLILCPTRELAIQVAGQIDLLGKFLGIRALPIYGGTGYREQFQGLDGGATIVVGTPGRVVDHIEKGSLKLDKLEVLVLDEADEMISMGFQEDLENVMKAAPAGQANIWLFSATMGPEVRHVADSYLRSPEKVQINKTEVLSANVEQIYFMVHEYDKPELLCKIIETADDFYGIIFCQTKVLVSDLTDHLTQRGYNVGSLHGDLTQDARDRVMNMFRDRRITILIATDVACRGLDVKDISHVVNYSLPRELDNYVHRIGRTARSGKSGIAISLVTRSHVGLVRRLEQVTRSRMVEGKIPSQREVAAKKMNKDRANFEAQTLHSRAQGLLGDEWKALLEGMEKEEIAARFLVMLHPETFADKAEKMRDSRAASQEAPQRGGYESRSPRGGRDSRSGGYESRNPRTSGGGGYRSEQRFDKPRFEKPRFEKPRFEKPRFEENFDKPAKAAKRTEAPAIDIPELFDDGPVAPKAPKFDKPKFEAREKPAFEKPRFEKRKEARSGGFDKPKRFEKSFDKPVQKREDRLPPWERKQAAPSAVASSDNGFKPQKRFGKLPPWQQKEESRPWMAKEKPARWNKPRAEARPTFGGKKPYGQGSKFKQRTES